MASWSAFGGGVASFAGDLAGSAFQSNQNARESSRQRKFIREQMQNRYQWTADDMEKAGLNRILAMGGQPPVTGGSAASISAPALGTSAVKGAMARSQVRNLNSSTAKNVQEANTGRALQTNYSASAKATQLDNVRREQEAEFYKNNPTARKIKLWIDSLSGGGGALSNVAAAGVGALGGAAMTKGKVIRKKKVSGAKKATYRKSTVKDKKGNKIDVYVPHEVKYPHLYPDDWR